LLFLARHLYNTLHVSCFITLVLL